MQNRYTGDIGDFGKLGQYRTEIVRILRRQINSAFAFCAARPAPLGRTTSDFVSAADCTN